MHYRPRQALHNSYAPSLHTIKVLMQLCASCVMHYFSWMLCKCCTDGAALFNRQTKHNSSLPRVLQPRLSNSVPLQSARRTKTEMQLRGLSA